MSISKSRDRKTWIIGSIALASVALFLGTLIGVFAVSTATQNLASPFEIPAHATAAYSEDGSVMAIGRISPDLEGVFYLDAITGELKAAVLNPRTKKFMATYNRKILDDFNKGEAVKNPVFMMATGVVDLPQISAGNLTFADSVVYVLELTTGKLACYGFQIPANIKNAKVAYSGEFLGFDLIEIRKTRVRPDS